MARVPSVLPPALLDVMLVDVAAPPRTVADVAAAACTKRSVLARVGTAKWPVMHEPGWRAWVANADKKVLFDDGATRSWLVRMAAGAALPPHGHDDGDEECVVLQGDLWIDGRRLGAGDYTVALRGSRHEMVRTATGALIVLRSPSPRATAQHVHG